MDYYNYDLCNIYYYILHGFYICMHACHIDILGYPEYVCGVLLCTVYFIYTLYIDMMKYFLLVWFCNHATAACFLASQSGWCGGVFGAVGGHKTHVPLELETQCWNVRLYVHAGICQVVSQISQFAWTVMCRPKICAIQLQYQFVFGLKARWFFIHVVSPLALGFSQGNGILSQSRPAKTTRP